MSNAIRFGATHFISTKGLSVRTLADLKGMLGDEQVKGPFNGEGNLIRVTTRTPFDRQIVDEIVDRYKLTRQETPIDVAPEAKDGTSMPMALANMWARYAARPPGSGLPGINPKFSIFAKDQMSGQVYTVDGPASRRG
jgi:hypothetical protein